MWNAGAEHTHLITLMPGEAMARQRSVYVCDLTERMQDSSCHTAHIVPVAGLIARVALVIVRYPSSSRVSS
jgi:hypothetical protein